MQALPDRARRLCSLLALVSLAAGVATLPLSVRSAAHPGSVSPAFSGAPVAVNVATPVPIWRNPFAGDLATGRAEPRRSPTANLMVMAANARPRDALPIVSAIAVGDHPSAVLEENGVSRIRAIGDRVGAHAIVTISLDGVRLDDGTLLVLSGGTDPGPSADPYPAIPIGAHPLPDVRGDSR